MQLKITQLVESDSFSHFLFAITTSFHRRHFLIVEPILKLHDRVASKGQRKFLQRAKYKKKQ